jgi:hypothetical protein
VARAIFGINFKNPRGFLEICGLRVDIKQLQGLLCKVARIFGFWNYFPMGKGGELGPWVSGPRKGGRSTVPLWTPQWLIVGAQPGDRSPELGWWRGGSEMTVKWRRR